MNIFTIIALIYLANAILIAIVCRLKFRKNHDPVETAVVFLLSPISIFLVGWELCPSAIQLVSKVVERSLDFIGCFIGGTPPWRKK